ncbi:phage tail protein [Enterobacter sp. A11]|uniref:tail fiber assembly protein n=1 Tax=unclassified Enterobacter TaxID=2608935 RepID=UPI00106F1EC0|nr:MULTISPECIES: tail fiber assembly protein [unclassified Enterobacter]MBM1021545.1 tail fiber assembly protein [Enterobacter sp. E1]MEA3563260.1 tail fiber assembly protein [Enterobacter sp. GM-22]MEA3596667.1 tail fiber assembly protein [Enterobacter sp. GM-31]TFF58138.1 phage tail protein [Enterobacter sp. A11]
MGYVYRASTGGFYCDELEAEYRKAGTWPGFFVRVSDDDYRNLMEGVSQGKIIVPNKQCYPVLQEHPAPSSEELIFEAEIKRKKLIDAAMQSIAVIQLKQMNGRMLSESELTKLSRVLDYIELLEAVDTENILDIDWPALPA